MLLLLRLLRRYRILSLFLLLEFLALLLYYRGRNYGAAYIYQNIQAAVLQLHVLQFGFQYYFSLRSIHSQLLEENFHLREEISRLQSKLPTPLPNFPITSSEKIRPYELLLAKVVRNSYTHTHNSITLDKGSAEGLHPGMGLIGPEGIVGRIKYVSEHFSTAYSLLDTDLLTSVQLGRNGVLCSVRWPAKDAQTAALEYVPRYVRVRRGDTAYTSGYDNIYPAMLPVGVIVEVKLQEDATFYRIALRLLTDFRTLHHVYALKLPRRAERDSLQQLMHSQ